MRRGFSTSVLFILTANINIACCHGIHELADQLTDLTYSKRKEPSMVCQCTWAWPFTQTCWEIPREFFRGFPWEDPKLPYVVYKLVSHDILQEPWHLNIKKALTTDGGTTDLQDLQRMCSPSRRRCGRAAMFFVQQSTEGPSSSYSMWRQIL